MGAPRRVSARPPEPAAGRSQDAPGRPLPGSALAQRAGEVRRGTRALALGVAAALILASPAFGSPRQESIFMDDARLVYAPPDEVNDSLATMKALGADRVRASLYWHLIEPAKPETW